MHALSPRPRLLGVALAGAALGLLALGGEDPVPWPGDEPPSDATLAPAIETALSRDRQRRLDEYLDAWEPGVQAAGIDVLQEDVDAGLWSIEALAERGAALLEHEFRASDGRGSTGQPEPAQRVHRGRRGGLDGFSCAGCHGRGGPGGAGAAPSNAFLRGDGDDVESAVARNPPALLGAGYVQALAAEMSVELQQQRDEARTRAAEDGTPVEVALESKGVAFGTLEARPDGTVDPAGLVGVDDDLVIKPFGWKGEFASLRRMVEQEALVHFGIQSHVLALAHQADPDPERLGSGPDWEDPDDDGHARELEEGTLTAAAVALALLPAPQLVPPHDPALRERWARGSALFDQVGCDECHRRELPLSSPQWQEHPDTTAGPPVTLDLLRDGQAPTAGPRVQLYSDLRRHDLGPQLADPHEQPADAIPPQLFLTRPLWGLAESAPYLHDGRATTIVEAILAHDGEAQPAQQAFAELPPDAQADLHVFLLSLSVAPRLRVAR
ncbi:MAG: hypothetical protein KDK70_21525 [Myxococcales bacterium]|nr:hypothetical protein [Myxococcales bacterium]